MPLLRNEDRAEPKAAPRAQGPRNRRGLLSRLSLLFFTLPLGGCLLLSYNELEPFNAKPLHQRVTLMPRINWIARDDAAEFCLSVMRQARITPPSDRPFACSFWNKEEQLCTIVTSKSTTHSFLGHELRHCFEGNFHESIDIARRGFPTPIEAERPIVVASPAVVVAPNGESAVIDVATATQGATGAAQIPADVPATLPAAPAQGPETTIVPTTQAASEATPAALRPEPPPADPGPALTEPAPAPAKTDDEAPKVKNGE